MRHLRTLVPALCLILVSAMGCASDDSTDATTTSAAATTTVQETTTSRESSTTSTSTTIATTTTTVARDLVVEFPFEGFWMTECELGGYGIVQPHAVVSVGGVQFVDDGPDRSNPGWWYWFENTAAVAVEPGVNLLEFVATYDDGSTLVETVTVTCDPALRAVPGYITSMTAVDGSGFEVVFNAGVIDDQPDGWAIIDTSPINLDVDEGVMFVAFNGQPAGNTRFILTAAEFAEQTSDCTPTNPVPYELLVDSDNQVRQAIQLESTLHFCQGE